MAQPHQRPARADRPARVDRAVHRTEDLLAQHGVAGRTRSGRTAARAPAEWPGAGGGVHRLDAMKYTTIPINASTSLSTNVE